MSYPLETNRLLLRQVKQTDALPLYHMIYHNHNVLKTFLARYMNDSSEATVDNLIRFQKAGRLIYIIEIKQTNEVIGMILEQDHTTDSIELGYAIGEPYWNQDYMTETLHAVIKHLFHLQYQRITAQCFQENKASAKVMQKCGMKKTNTSYQMSWQDKEHTVIEFEIIQNTGLS